MEDVMYDPPAYIWAITIATTTAIPAATSIVLYGGAVRAGRLLRRPAGPAPEPGGRPRPGGTGPGEPPGVPALVPGGRGGLPDHDGPRSPARAVRLARGPGRHRRRHRRAAGRVPARAGHGPPRRPVAQRVRHHRSGGGPDPRRPHRIPAAPR